MKGEKKMSNYHNNIFPKIISAILILCFLLLGLTACGNNPDNEDNNLLIQGTWEIDTGSGAGWKFENDKFWWVKSVSDFNDNYWYGDVEIYNDTEAMEIAGLTDEEVKSSLSGIDTKNIFVLKLDPEKIITDGEDKTDTNMTNETSWTHLWIIDETDGKTIASFVDLQTFKMDTYIKID